MVVAVDTRVRRKDAVDRLKEAVEAGLEEVVEAGLVVAVAVGAANVVTAHVEVG